MNVANLQSMANEEVEKQQQFRCRLLCCGSTPCLSSGATGVRDALQDQIKARSLDADVEILSTGCMGPCSRGPLVTVQLPGCEDVVYERVTPDKARSIVDGHVAQGDPVEAWRVPGDLPFFSKQKKVVLSNSGLIDPERLQDYVARGGYAALAHALTEPTWNVVGRTDCNLREKSSASCVIFVNL